MWSWHINWYNSVFRLGGRGHRSWPTGGRGHRSWSEIETCEYFIEKFMNSKKIKGKKECRGAVKYLL